MKKLLVAAIITYCGFANSAWSQVFALDPLYYTVFDQDSLMGFEESAARASAISENFLGSEFKVRMYRLKREYIDNKYNLVKAKPANALDAYLNANRPAAVPGCVNEDFEASAASVVTASGQVTGWVVNGGYNGSISASNTTSLITYFPGGLSGPNSCNLLGCCPMPPSKSAVIDCSAPGGFIDTQIGTQYPIYSVFGSGSANAAASAANPDATTPFFGGKVFRLNDGITGDYSIERISKTFAVTASNALFQFAFISVFNTGHGCCDAGGFQIHLSNATTNSVIPCPNFSVSAPSGACTATVPIQYYIAQTGANFTTNINAPVIYNRWKINSIDLSAYIGQSITINIIVGDCNAGGHYGKVYLDAQCGPMTVTGNGNVFDAGIANVVVPTCGASGATICAAAGLGPYYWAGPGITPNQATPSMTNQCLTSTISATYTLFMQPEGSCVPITRVVTSTITPAPLLVASALQASCGNTLAIVSVTPSGSAANPSSLTWSPTPLSINSSTTIGQYQIPTGQNTMVVTVVASDPLGCKVTATAGVYPAPPIPSFTMVNVSNSPSITCLTPSVQLDATSTYSYNNGSLNYFWASAGSTLTGNSNNITVPGTYTVYALDPATNCGSTRLVTVGVNTVVPSSTVSPTTKVINCGSPALPVFTLSAGSAVNVTHFITSPLGATVSVNSSTASYVAGVPGPYVHCLVNDINGCSTCKQFTVVANQGFPTFTLTSPQSYTLGCNTKSVATININNASATDPNQNPTGGAVSYSLLLPGTSSVTNTGTLSSNATYTVNLPGTYTVVVKDNLSLCESRVPISILSNTFAPNVSAVVSQQTLSCFVPSITLRAVSLTPNVEYNWSYLSLNQASDTLGVQINSAVPNNSLILNYTITVTDKSSTCRSTSVIPMYQNLFKPKVVISNGGVSSLTCKTGSVTLTNQSSTGIPSATGNPTSSPVVGFLWEGPTPQEPLSNSSTYVGLTPGAYTLTVKDLNNGCVNFTTTLIDDGRDFPRVTINGPVTRDCGSVSASITPEYLDALADMTYRWYAGEGNPGSVNSATLPTYNPTDIGAYFVEVTSKKSSCSVTASVAVVNGTISTKFEADKTSGFAPLKVNFDNQSRTSLDPVDTKVNNAIKSIWNFGNGTSETYSTTVDATVTYSLPGNYIVSLFANKGSCVQSFQKTITVELPSKAIIPNIFTPNNDKVNDVFRLEATNLSQVSMVIIDRWGHVVYDVNSTTGNVEWDGKNQRGAECAEGIYFYTIKATGTDGVKYDNKGTITLAR